MLKGIKKRVELAQAATATTAAAGGVKTLA